TTFLDFDGLSFTFQEISGLSDNVGHALSVCGVRPGDRVASLLNSRVEVVATWFGTSKAGAIWVPINTGFKAEFLAHPLRDSGATVLVCDSDYLERVLDIADDLTQLRQIVVCGE